MANYNTNTTPVTQQDDSVISQPDSTESAIVSVENNVLTVVDEKSIVSSLSVEKEHPCYKVLPGKRKQGRKKVDCVKLIDDMVRLEVR